MCPNAVGVDIGCGVCAVLVKDLHRDDVSREQLVQMQQMIKQRVPVGV